PPRAPHSFPTRRSSDLGALPARGSVPAPGAALATPRAGHRMSLLETRGLSKHFGGVHAVAGLDLTLAEGEVLGLIGPNGAGKTTDRKSTRLNSSHDQIS